VWFPKKVKRFSALTFENPEQRSKKTKIFGIANKLHFVQPRSEKFGICEQKQLKSTACCSAVQRNFWNCDQKHCILSSRAEKNLGIATITGFLSFPRQGTYVRCCRWCVARW
jgi:hypothetical protein